MMEKLSLEDRDRELNSCIHCRDGSWSSRVAQKPITGVLIPQPEGSCTLCWVQLRLAASDFRASVHAVPQRERFAKEMSCLLCVMQQAEQRLQQVTIGSIILWDRKILFMILTKQPNIRILLFPLILCRTVTRT